MVKNLDPFFSAKHIAVIGVSHDTAKVGHVVFRNFIDSHYKGKIFPVNPNLDEILGHKCYPSILKVKERVDLALICVPAALSIRAVEECGKKGIKNIIIITAGYKEVGNFELDKKMEAVLKKYKIACIGPNCLGTFDAHTGLDTLFLPRYRLKRPDEGTISFVTQSGAAGSAIMDYATENGYNFAKFVSYGNAMNIDESDIIEYLGEDEKTKVICLYLEGAKDGKKFVDVCRRVSKKKPIITIKGGITSAGSKAILSHTGALAGSVQIYFGAFKQARIIRAVTLEEMFEFAKILDKSMKPKGDRVQVITNGGGYGILSTDAIIKNKLKMAEMDKKIVNQLKKEMPPIVVIKNPIDLLGDATDERYEKAIDACMADKNIDIILVILLYQTPLISPDVVNTIIEANSLRKKPIIVVSTGGEFTEILSEGLEENGVPCYSFPNNAVKSIKHLFDYYNKR
ncbi:acetate--CoA ligase family protein [Candidatus Aenigmatarchaeota archaeon]